jgi:deoxyguanosine kinase
VPSHPYIAIEGAIGVGKTTLARILGEALRAEVLLEVFEENPFLSDFYADRARYAFQTQIFFLLSRYRQQHKVIAKTLRLSPLVSDYLFAKDWLFAHLNLGGDELAMYERVHAILGEQIPLPSLVVYLKASSSTLMRRIAFRDRAYERQMSEDYIDALRIAYEAFFAEYTAAPILVLDTDDLDMVHDDSARVEVIRRARNALEANSHQLAFPGITEPAHDAPAAFGTARRLPDFQRFHRILDRESDSLADLYMHYISLAEALGSLGHTVKLVWLMQDQLAPRVGNRLEARARSLEEAGADLHAQLATALTYLLKLANDAGVDLESAYLAHLNEMQQRRQPEGNEAP